MTPMIIGITIATVVAIIFVVRMCFPRPELYIAACFIQSKSIPGYGELKMKWCYATSLLEAKNAIEVHLLKEYAEKDWYNPTTNVGLFKLA